VRFENQPLIATSDLIDLSFQAGELLSCDIKGRCEPLLFGLELIFRNFVNIWGGKTSGGDMNWTKSDSTGRRGAAKYSLFW
jgi:hypothetical protein